MDMGASMGASTTTRKSELILPVCVSHVCSSYGCVVALLAYAKENKIKWKNQNLPIPASEVESCHVFFVFLVDNII